MIKSAGEHWVCSVLARVGWAPALTRDGLARTDILAANTRDERQLIEVQVKTTTASNWLLGSNVQRPAISEREWFALVMLGDEPAQAPRTFVVPRDHVAAAAWIAHTDWLTEPGIPPGRRNTGYDRARCHHSWFERYEDRWDLLGTPTGKVPVLLHEDWRDLALSDRVGLPDWHPWAKRFPKR